MEGTNLTETICALLSAALGNILTDIVVSFELMPDTGGQCCTVSMVLLFISVYDYFIVMHACSILRVTYWPLINCIAICSVAHNLMCPPLPQTKVIMQLWVVYRL